MQSFKRIEDRQERSPKEQTRTNGKEESNNKLRERIEELERMLKEKVKIERIESKEHHRNKYADNYAS